MNMLIKIFCLVFIISVNKVFAQTCKAYDVERDQIQSLFQFTDFNQLKNYQIQYQRKNPMGFCERNMKLRFLKANKLISSQQCLQLSNKDLENFVVRNFEKDRSNWSIALMPKLEFKKQAYELNEQAILDFDHFDLYPKYPTPELKKQYFQKINKIIDKYAYTTFAAQSSAADWKIKAFCSMEKLLNSDECFQLLTWARDQFAPRGRGVDIIDVDLWRRVVASDNYDKGLLKTLESFQNREEFTGQENIFSDLKKSFIQTGMTDNKAENAAWDILGFISNQGSSISAHMSMVDNADENKNIFGGINLSPKAKLIGQIAAAMVYQDYLNNQKGLPLYSYPANIKTACDSYKPYHFWMSAFIAREIVRNFKVSPRSAAAAAFMTEKGYQINRDIAGDGGKQNKVTSVFGYGAFDPVHQVIRIDLAYAAVGAQFGAESLLRKNKIYDFQKSMDALLRGSGEMMLEEDVKKNAPKQSLFRSVSNFFGGYPERLNNYIQWNSIFQADQAFLVLEW